MANEEVRIKTGVDNTMLSRGLVDAENKFSAFARNLKGGLGSLKSAAMGYGALNLFAIGESLSETMLNFAQKSAELGRFWGTWLSGGQKALEEIRKEDGLIVFGMKLWVEQSERLKRRYEELLALNRQRWEIEKKLIELEASAQEKSAIRAYRIADIDGKILQRQQEITKLETDRAALQQKNNPADELKIKEMLNDIEEKRFDLSELFTEKSKRQNEEWKDQEKEKLRLMKEQTNARNEFLSALQRIKNFNASMDDQFKPTHDKILEMGSFGRGRNKNTWFPAWQARIQMQVDDAKAQLENDVMWRGVFDAKMNPQGINISDRRSQIDKMEKPLRDFYGMENPQMKMAADTAIVAEEVTKAVVALTTGVVIKETD